MLDPRTPYSPCLFHNSLLRDGWPCSWLRPMGDNWNPFRRGSNGGKKLYSTRTWRAFRRRLDGMPAREIVWDVLKSTHFAGMKSFAMGQRSAVVADWARRTRTFELRQQHLEADSHIFHLKIPHRYHQFSVRETVLIRH